MAYKVVTSSKVHFDIEKGIEWYKEIQIELAKRFLKEVGKIKKTILKNPEKFQVRYSNIRIAFLDKFPFGIHYKIENDTIFLLAIFHFKENPDSWTK